MKRKADYIITLVVLRLFILFVFITDAIEIFSGYFGFIGSILDFIGYIPAILFSMLVCIIVYCIKVLSTKDKKANSLIINLMIVPVVLSVIGSFGYIFELIKGCSSTYYGWTSRRVS